MSILKKVNTSLSGKLVLPNTITRIDSNAFEYCKSLTSVTIPDSVTSIGHRAFENCTSLKSINIPDGVISIDEYTFSNCTSLEDIAIPDSVLTIEYNAFSNCRSLTSIVIPERVMVIGDSAFSGCTSLTSIVIPESVTRIGNSAFVSCTNLPITEFYTGTNTVIENGVLFINNTLFTGIISGKYFKDGSLFTGTTEDGSEYVNGIEKFPIFAEYSGDSFSCHISKLSRYDRGYIIFKFTPNYSGDYVISRNVGDTVVKISTNRNEITGSYDANAEEYIYYFDGGTTYYIGVAMHSDTTGFTTLSVYPYSGSSSSSNPSSTTSSNYYEESSSSY